MESLVNRPQVFVPLDVREGVAIADYELRLVACREEWDAVGDLRYRAYREREDIDTHPDAQLREPADTALNAMTFLLTRGGVPVGSTRTTVRSSSRPWPLPGYATYRREIEAAIGEEATIVEASRTIVDPMLTADSRTPLFHLLRAQMLHCRLEDADWLVCAVRESEIGFYRRMLNMEILSGPELYPGLNTPKVLMGLDVRSHLALLAKRIPLLAITREDQETFAASGFVSAPRGRR